MTKIFSGICYEIDNSRTVAARHTINQLFAGSCFLFFLGNLNQQIALLVSIFNISVFYNICFQIFFYAFIFRTRESQDITRSFFCRNSCILRLVFINTQRDITFFSFTMQPQHRRINQRNIFRAGNIFPFFQINKLIIIVQHLNRKGDSVSISAAASGSSLSAFLSKALSVHRNRPTVSVGRRSCYINIHRVHTRINQRE